MLAAYSMAVKAAGYAIMADYDSHELVVTPVPTSQAA